MIPKLMQSDDVCSRSGTNAEATNKEPTGELIDHNTTLDLLFYFATLATLALHVTFCIFKHSIDTLLPSSRFY